MTRFATFWVEQGSIQAPLNVMRFDESIYRMLGEHLVDLTTERDFILDAIWWFNICQSAVRRIVVAYQGRCPFFIGDNRGFYLDVVGHKEGGGLHREGWLYNTVCRWRKFRSVGGLRYWEDPHRVVIASPKSPMIQRQSHAFSLPVFAFSSLRLDASHSTTHGSLAESIV